MRAAIITIAVLCFATGIMASQPNQTATKGKQSAEAQRPAAPSPQNNSTTYYQAEQPHKDAPRWYASPEWWLVAIGALTAFAIWYQARETSRAAKATQRSTEAIEKQAGIMERQTKAAEDAAKAALLNAQAIINTDRPWVSIFSQYKTNPFRVCFKIANLGNTPAEVVSFAFGFRCVTDEMTELPLEPEYGKPQVPTITLLVPSGGEPTGASIELLSFEEFAKLADGCARWTDKMEHALEWRPKVAVFYFHILYTSPLSRLTPAIQSHETRMCFRFSP